MSDSLFLQGSTWLVSLLLVLITIGFVWRFILPAVRLGVHLEHALEALAALRPAAPGKVLDLNPIAQQVMVMPPLNHLWREYAQTLHPNTASDAQGRSQVTAWRATVMAENFFTEQALVDIPLRTEFYKHLPGILTGLGIIGTFSGLILGLTHFEVSNNPELVRGSLRLLVQGVGHAFKVSAAAITLAMLFTWVEKSLVAARYRQVARLVAAIDSLFDAGVGEEYLARLVRATETSATQTGQLRQALAGELKQVMTTLAQQQLDSAARQQEISGAQIAWAINEALREPMNRVAEAVERLSQRQDNSAAQTLERLLDNFSKQLTAQMEGSLGQGQASLQRLLMETTQTLHATVNEFRRMAEHLEQLVQASMQQTAGQLQAVGQGLGAAANQAASTFSSVSGDLQATANALASAGQSASQIMAEHKQAQQMLGQTMGELRTLLDTARREAGLSSDLLSRMERAAQTLGQAEKRAEGYLANVTEVLGQAHGAFADNVEKTLRQGNTQFQRELAAAVDYLKGAIEMLGDTLDSLPVRR